MKRYRLKDWFPMSPGLPAHLVARAQSDLRSNILPYWMRVAPVRERGGFVGRVGPGEVADPNASRGALLTSRILWTFSAAHRRWPEPRTLEMAAYAHRDLINHFWDQAEGGFHWTITGEGVPLDKTRNIYGQAFGIYALSEYFRATDDPAALDRAVEVYRLLDRHARDRENGGFFELFSADWQPLDSTTAAVMDMGQGAKSQNTHLHLMEAFTNLLRVWPDAGLRKAQEELVGLMLNRVLDQETWHLGLFFDEDWEVVSNGVSYGHDIEAAWLILEAAEQLDEPALIGPARRAAVEIARVTLAEGLDTDGALVYAGDPGGPTDLRRDWWPQAEAVVGFLNAWQVSADSVYLDAAARLWAFIEAKFIDREHGGWFKTVNPDGTVLRDNKIDLWTCPYHNGRAEMELIDRLTD